MVIPTTTTALHTLRYGSFGEGGNSGFGRVLMSVVVMVGFFGDSGLVLLVAAVVIVAVYYYFWYFHQFVGIVSGGGGVRIGCFGSSP